MTGAELLVDAPRMQRDLQRARAENARLRAALARLSASGDAEAADGAQQSSDEDEESGGGGKKSWKKAGGRPERALQDDEEDDEEEFVAVRGGGQPRGERSKALELKNAEERIAQLERRLLDAEETMCHLKAEKLAALRDCERLQRALEAAAHNGRVASDLESDDGGDQATAMRRLVLELEAKLSDAEKDRAFEQEQHMAVIREQEEEIRTLMAAAEEKDLELASLREKYLDAVQEIQLAADMGAIDASVASSIKQQPDYEEEQEEPIASAEILDWREELVRHPTPHFDLDSPEVQYLLHTWTGNVKKLHYLRLWFSRVATTRGPLPEDFPLGIELPRLTPEVRDGFLTLVVPLLRRQTEREIQVHSRRYNDPLHSDLRIRVVPRR